MRDLSFEYVWLTGGALLVLLVIVMSLVPATDSDVPALLYDKNGHVIAYCTLMTWFAGIWRRNSHWAVALGLLALGLTLEWLQRFVALRASQVLDMVANGAGVALGLLLARLLGLDRWCDVLERTVLRVNRSIDGP